MRVSEVTKAKTPLLQPNTLEAVLFALRTTVAALVALAIAFWMEMDQPQWAPMTVWIVAQNSRGMSLSKGRWRIVGTIGGIVAAFLLIGAFPQHPWLFFTALIIFSGLCAASASLVQNFRGYALVLMGYTGAIISLGAVEHPDQIFDVAMARGTYILLGVVCEMIAGMVFVPGAARRVRDELRVTMLGLISRSCHALEGVARGEEGAVATLCQILGSLQALNDQLEFARIEARHHDRYVVDRAYATLALLAVVLSRGVGLRSRMESVGVLSPSLRQEMVRYADGLGRLADICQHNDVTEAVAWGRRLLGDCQQRLESCLARNDEPSFQEAIVLTGLETMLADMREVLLSHAAGIRGIGLPEKYRLHRRSDWMMALFNSTRTMAALLWGAVVWETTAWSYGSYYMIFIAVVCTRFSTFNNAALVSRQFFHGAVWAVVASIVPVFIVMPVTSGYPMLAVTLGFFMFLGGLALRYPPYAISAASYANFFPWALGLNNQNRIDELYWFNICFVLLLALWSGVVVFRVVLPFTFRQALSSWRHQLQESLRRLGRIRLLTAGQARLTQYAWVDDTTQRMEQIFRFSGQLSQSEMDAMVKGTLSVMTIGRNIMTLRQMQQMNGIPDTIVMNAEKLLQALLAPTMPDLDKGSFPSALQLSVTTDNTETIMPSAGSRQDVTLQEVFSHALTPRQRHDLAQGAGCLMILQYEFPISRAFLTQPRIVEKLS